MSNTEPEHLVRVLRLTARKANLLANILDPPPLGCPRVRQEWAGSSPGKPSRAAVHSTLLSVQVAGNLLMNEFQSLARRTGRVLP